MKNGITDRQAWDFEGKAYSAGFTDGQAWYLDGFRGWPAVGLETDWASETINACGKDACARMWGVDSADNAEWQRAIDDYNLGVHDGIWSDGHTGLPPTKVRA